MKGNDKRIPRKQVIDLLHGYYDDLERASNAALIAALVKVYGFDEEQVRLRFLPTYSMYLGAEGEKQVTEARDRITRILR